MLRWRDQKSAERAEKRTLMLRRVEAPVPATIADPLARPRPGQRMGRVTAATAGLFVAAGFAHGTVLAAFLGASMVLGGSKASRPKPQRITARIVQAPEPPVVQPLPEPKPLPEPPPEPEAPKASPRPKRPKATPKPKRKPIKKNKPIPADPINLDKPKPKPKRKARRIAGLSLGSTAKGGKGPAFAVGNTRMARTERVAENPLTPKTLPNEPAPRINRKASRLPIGYGGSTLTKPKYAGQRIEPHYPEDYRAQNLEAEITVEVIIGPKGRVKTARIIAGSAYKKFEKEALATARQQRWVPAKRDGRPIRYTLSYTYYFTLKD